MTGPRVSIIIISYNTRELLARCLEAAFRHSAGTPAEIFVVDNASSDGSADMVSARFPNARLLRNSENLGFAKANNQALKLAKGDFILLLNSDALLTKGAVEALLNFALARPRAAITGPRLVTGEGKLQPSTYTVPSPATELLKTLRLYKLLPAPLNARLFLSSFFDHRSSRQAGRLTGACVMLRRSALNDLGPLSEDFFFYGEIHDWCLRALGRGWEVWFCADAEVVHLGGQSSGKKWGSAERLAVNLRETERLYNRHLSAWAKWALFALRLVSSLLGYAWRSLTGRNLREPEAAAAIRAEAAWLLRRFLDTAFWFLRRSAPARLFFASAAHKEIFLSRLAALAGTGARDLKSWMRESASVKGAILSAWGNLPSRPSRTGMIDFTSAEIIYALVRALRPDRVTETGVANGISSCYILAAMEANGRGRLVSVDCVPEGAPNFLPEGKTAGWLVPDGLRPRWELVTGKTSEKLPPLLERDAPLDIFIHDSEHSYDNMLFEYSSAWPRLRQGGLLLTDDAGLTYAFRDFSRKAGALRIVLADKLGVIRKETQER